MIKLFSPEDTDFSSNGEVVLKATKARVFNSDNGEFYLEMSCGAEYSDYVNPEYLLAVPTPNGQQVFRISELDKTAKKIEAKAKHISYDSKNYIVPEVTANNCSDFLGVCNNNTDITSPFNLYSDISTEAEISAQFKTLEECLQLALETYGGHIVRDNYSISILEDIGTDYGETIEYRKNLEELTATYNFNEVCTKVLPVGKDDLTLPETYVYLDSTYSTPHTKVVQFQQDLEQGESETDDEFQARLIEDLRAQAYEYLNANCLPFVNYTIKGFLETPADIGDKIMVKDARLGVSLLTSVSAYEYDAIREKYISLEFGNVQKSLGELLKTINNTTNTTVNNAITNETTNINNQITVIENSVSEVSSQVESVQETTESISSDVSVAQADISALQSSIATAQGDITQLQSDMSSAQSDILDLYNNKSDYIVGGNHVVVEDEHSERQVRISAKTEIKRITMSSEFSDLGDERRADLCYVRDDYSSKTIQYKKEWDTILLLEDQDNPPTANEGVRGQLCIMTSNHATASNPFHILNIYVKVDEGLDWVPLYTS